MILKSSRLFISLLVCLIFLSACGPYSNGNSFQSPTPTIDSSLPTPSTITHSSETYTPSPTITLPPSATPTQMVRAERIPIIEYHNPTYNDSNIVMMTTEWFESQMQWLSENGYKTLNANELVDFLNGGAYPQKSVIISFDIGVGKHTEYSQIVIPTLRKYGFTAIVFLLVNTNLIGDECNKGELYCWSELRAWSDEGLISVESHGIYHQDYKTLDAASQKQDAGDSKRVIEENIGKPVLGFAYPYDSVNTKSYEILKSLGYQFAAGGFTRPDRSVTLGDPNRYNLPRVYPYSNRGVYPLLSTMKKMTFEQMIISQTELIGLPTPTATQPGVATTTPTMINLPTNLTPAGSATPETVEVTSPVEYIGLCNIINKTTDPVLRIYQLDHLVFHNDISPQTQAALPAQVILKPSCNVRPTNQPRAIILHFTRGPLDAAISTFQKDNNTSAHYIIDRDGKVYQVVPENLGAYHVSCYGLRSNCVASCPICEGTDGLFVEPATQSIGIELVNQGQVLFGSFKGLIYEDYSMSFNYRYWEDYPEAQIKSLVLLVEDIRGRWGIPLDMVMGHYRINTNSDPGPALNLFWDRYGNPPRKAIFPSP
jgi:N-acetyl-anhydromuramyl-L-alanine amidase AmpD/peptidoglycan/xylan/chitin deacetylase (PgdA/CDA1 family)